MNKITVLLALIGMSINLYGQEKLDELNLKGNVKSVKQLTYDAVEKFGEIELGDLAEYYKTEDNYLKEFNIKGLQTKSVEFDYLGETKSKETNLYNDDSEMIESTYVVDNVKMKWFYTYDENGNRINELNEDKKVIVISKYNDKGNIVSQYFPYQESTHTFKYNDKNQLIEKTNILSGNTSIFISYDNNGNMIKEVDGINNDSTVFVYNTKSKLIREEKYKGSDGSIKSLIKYNDNSTIQLKGTIDFRGLIRNTYKYKYDEKNNWIIRIEYDESEPKHITTRTIEYY